jgi:hypothetical protein
MSNKVLEKEGKFTRLVHINWSKTNTKENSIFGNFPVEMLIPAIFLSGIFFRFSHFITFVFEKFEHTNI